MRRILYSYPVESCPAFLTFSKVLQYQKIFDLKAVDSQVQVERETTTILKGHINVMLARTLRNFHELDDAMSRILESKKKHPNDSSSINEKKRGPGLCKKQIGLASGMVRTYAKTRQPGKAHE